MSDHAVLFEYDEPVPPPVKPIKGAWGVGKEYRKHRRHYAKAMRAYKRGNQTMHRKIYIPHATFEKVGESFEILGRAAADASEAIANSFERLYENRIVAVDPGVEVLEGKIVDPPTSIPIHLWGTPVDFIEGPDDYTYDVPIPTKTNFSAEIQFEPTEKNLRKLFGLL